MKSIDSELSNKNKLLILTAHPDDESYTFAGLILRAHELGLTTTLVSFTPKGKDKDSETSEEELRNAAHILGIDSVVIKNFTPGKLHSNRSDIRSVLKEVYANEKPDIVATFDYSGITGHIDHLALSSEVSHFNNRKNMPTLLLRVPDDRERRFFKRNEHLKYALPITHTLQYGFGTALTKIKAILAYKSRFKTLSDRLHIYEWNLFDHYELYHKFNPMPAKLKSKSKKNK